MSSSNNNNNKQKVPLTLPVKKRKTTAHYIPNPERCRHCNQVLELHWKPRQHPINTAFFTFVRHAQCPNHCEYFQMAQNVDLMYQEEATAQENDTATQDVMEFDVFPDLDDATSGKK